MEISIKGRRVGEKEPVFIVAEMSANHLQNFGKAKKLIHAAKQSGADAIKLQTYTPDTMTINCAEEHFTIQEGTIWDGKSLYQLYSEAMTPWEWHEDLIHEASKEGIILFSSPFDRSAVDFLEELDMPAYKIASFEITDLDLIASVASTQKPVIISTGVATVGEINEAVETCRKSGNEQIILLHCTSSYPAPIEGANLRTIPRLSSLYGVLTGLSDHTTSIAVPVAAVALGAVMIEKHLTLCRSDGGPDASFSLEPGDFAEMTGNIRTAERALGSSVLRFAPHEISNRFFIRSLYAVEDISEGETLTEKNVKPLRPGGGLHPRYYRLILGDTARKKIKKGTPLSWDLINGAKE